MDEMQQPKPLPKITKYWPLFTLILIAVVMASVLSVVFEHQDKAWMHFFMGIFLCQFAMLKLFHPVGFADGFQMYDLIGKKSRVYAYCYPIIELALGLWYLSFAGPIFTYIVTVILFTVGSVGVIHSLIKGLDVRCVCMGTALDVPLSTVTLVEDLSMLAMALLLLIY